MLHVLRSKPVVALAIISFLSGGAAANAFAPGQIAKRPATALHLVPARIIGKDKRLPVPEELHQLASGIGLLTGTSGLTCTAFCVHARVIATNSHCLFRSSGNRGPEPLQNKLFSLPGDASRKQTLTSRIEAAVGNQILLSIASGWSRADKPTPDRPHFTASIVERDWGLVRLQSDICAGKEIPLMLMKTAKRILAREENLPFMIGYHDKSRTVWDRKYAPDCVSDDAREQNLFKKEGMRIVEHSCDSKPGSSGSPILIKNGNGFEAVAINAGTLKYFLLDNAAASGKAKNKQSQLIREINSAVAAEVVKTPLRRFADEHLLQSLDAVAEVQTLLKAGGHYLGAIDSAFGPASRAAVIEFERRVGLLPLGVPTEELLAHLRETYGARLETSATAN